MAKRILYTTRTNASTPTGATSEMQASYYNQLEDKGNNPGLATSTVVSLRADDEYYASDSVQSGVRSYVKDASVIDGEGIGNGYHEVFESDGSAITFSTDFDVITADTPIAGEKFAITAVWRGAKFSVSLQKVSGSSNWSSFNGTTSHIYFGNVLDPHIAGADKKFSIGIDVRNWTDGNGRGFYCTGNTVGDDDAFNSLINATTFNIPFSYKGGAGTLGSTETVETITSAATNLRIEYDGSIDTADIDRVKTYFNGIEQTVVQKAASQGFPFDITSVVRELAFGIVRSPNGSIISGLSLIHI